MPAFPKAPNPSRSTNGSPPAARNGEGSKQLLNDDGSPIFYTEETYEHPNGNDLVVFQDHWFGHRKPGEDGSSHPPSTSDRSKTTETDNSRAARSTSTMTAGTALQPANPQQLTALYGQFPRHDRLRIRSVNVNPSGPTLTLRVDLPEFPAQPPEEWTAAGCDTVQCHLQFLAVEQPLLSRWSSPAEARLNAQPVSDRLTEVRLNGPGIELAFRANPQFVIRHISAFRAAADEPELLHLSRLDTKLHGTNEPATTTETFYAR